MRDAMFTIGLGAIVAASMTDGMLSEALNHAGLSAGLVGVYFEAFHVPGKRAGVTPFAPEPGQHSYRRWNADGTYDTVIWPYGYSALEDQFMPQGNRIPPNVRS